MCNILTQPKLLLIRHGQTTLNTKGRVHSQQDSTVQDLMKLAAGRLCAWWGCAGGMGCALC